MKIFGDWNRLRMFRLSLSILGNYVKKLKEILHILNFWKLFGEQGIALMFK